jgi:hypothetical protein
MALALAPMTQHAALLVVIVAAMVGFLPLIVDGLLELCTSRTLLQPGQLVLYYFKYGCKVACTTATFYLLVAFLQLVATIIKRSVQTTVAVSKTKIVVQVGLFCRYTKRIHTNPYHADGSCCDSG